LNADAEIRATATAWLARLDGDPAPAECAEFDRWCAADPRHAAVVDELRAAWSALDQPRAAGRTDALRRGLHVRARRRHRRRLFAAATACGLLALVTLPWLEKPAVPSPGIATQVRVVETRRLTLPDGSVAELSPQARIETDFGPDRRRIALLAGEAHFDVVKDAARPFVVAANGVQVRAVGTAFAVDISDGNVQVVVTEGTVAVAEAAPTPAAPDAAPAAPTLLVAGHALTVAPHAPVAAAPVALDAADLARRLAWRTPRIEFTETTLHDAVALFNARNAVQLRIADARLGELRITGVFRADNCEGFVDLLGKTFPLVAAPGPGVIVLRAIPAR
jgi:transmembrane sensor